MPLFGPPNVKELEAGRNVKGLIKALGYKKDWIVRHTAAEALGRIGDARAVKPLSVALKDTYIGHDAAEALGRIGDARAVKPLSAALNDTDSLVRRAAAEALGRIGDARAVEPLSAALKDTDNGVRYHAAEALGQIGDPRAVEPLSAALKDTDSGVRYRAVEALDRLGWQPDRSEVGAAYWAAKHAWDNCVRIGAPAVEPLSAVLGDEEWSVRQAAAGALGRIADACAVEPLVAALRDADGRVRQAAAEALGQIGDARAVESLIATLNDQFYSVRQTTAGALDKLGWQPDRSEVGAAYWAAKGEWNDCVKIGALAVKPLVAALKGKDANVRQAAAGALVKIGAPAVEPLSAALGDWDRHVRCSAAGALGQLGVQLEDVALQTQAVVHLVNALGDETGSVRRAAAEMLVNLHRTGCLDEQVKQRILAQRERMAIPHTDISGGHDDLGTQHYDYGGRSCYIHDDRDVPHQDSGIGVIL